MKNEILQIAYSLEKGKIDEETAKQELCILLGFIKSGYCVSDEFIDNVCLSYRHDFGLLSEDEQNKVRFECKEWMRAIKNNEPY